MHISYVDYYDTKNIYIMNMYMHLHGDKKRKWYEAYFFLYVRIVCNILYIYIISRRPARSTNEHGRIETYSCLCGVLVCRGALELYY